MVDSQTDTSGVERVDEMIEVSRFGITARFDRSPWPEAVPSLYRPFLGNVFYEQELLDYVRSLGRRGAYVDAGSCLGTHTVWFAAYCPSSHVHSFDPRPQCAGWTKMNVDANDLAAKVTVHDIGLSDRQGVASATLDGVDVTFGVARMDTLVRGRVAVIKADVEGMESLALAGATKILRRHRPVVFAEAFTETELAAISAVLEPLGYRATGRVFNVTPTYEFAPPTPAWRSAVRRVARRLPKPARRALVRVRDALRPR